MYFQINCTNPITLYYSCLIGVVSGNNQVDVVDVIIYTGIKIVFSTVNITVVIAKLKSFSVK